MKNRLVADTTLLPHPPETGGVVVVKVVKAIARRSNATNPVKVKETTAEAATKVVVAVTKVVVEVKSVVAAKEAVRVVVKVVAKAAEAAQAPVVEKDDQTLLNAVVKVRRFVSTTYVVLAPTVTSVLTSTKEKLRKLHQLNLLLKSRSVKRATPLRVPKLKRIKRSVKSQKRRKRVLLLLPLLFLLLLVPPC